MIADSAGGSTSYGAGRPGSFLCRRLDALRGPDRRRSWSWIPTAGRTCDVSAADAGVSFLRADERCQYRSERSARVSASRGIRTHRSARTTHSPRRRRRIQRRFFAWIVSGSWTRPVNQDSQAAHEHAGAARGGVLDLDRAQSDADHRWWALMPDGTIAVVRAVTITSNS